MRDGENDSEHEDDVLVINHYAMASVELETVSIYTKANKPVHSLPLENLNRF